MRADGCGQGLVLADGDQVAAGRRGDQQEEQPHRQHGYGDRQVVVGQDARDLPAAGPQRQPGPRHARQAQVAAGDADPVLGHGLRDDREAQRTHHEGVAAQPQRRDAERHGHQARRNRAGADVQPERRAPAHRDEGGGVGAHPEERHLREAQHARVAQDQVQPERRQQERHGHDQGVQAVVAGDQRCQQQGREQRGEPGHPQAVLPVLDGKVLRPQRAGWPCAGRPRDGSLGHQKRSRRLNRPWGRKVSTRIRAANATPSRYCRPR